MQREIKFRAWEMRHRDMYTSDQMGGLKQFFGLFPGVCTSEIIMQYTGLKDKNGKEIYEGDIIRYVIINKYKIKLILCKVYFDMGAFYMEDIRLHGRSDLLSEAEPDDIEIIGNIYSSPELLKGGTPE